MPKNIQEDVDLLLELIAEKRVENALLDFGNVVTAVSRGMHIIQKTISAMGLLGCSAKIINITSNFAEPFTDYLQNLDNIEYGKDLKSILTSELMNKQTTDITYEEFVFAREHRLRTKMMIKSKIVDREIKDFDLNQLVTTKLNEIVETVGNFIELKKQGKSISDDTLIHELNQIILPEKEKVDKDINMQIKEGITGIYKSRSSQLHNRLSEYLNESLGESIGSQTVNHGPQVSDLKENLREHLSKSTSDNKLSQGFIESLSRKLKAQ